ncbi:hypothetical protein DFS34DRAFT_635974, partial [Phlyctochytrium arcticum]
MASDGLAPRKPKVVSFATHLKRPRSPSPLARLSTHKGRRLYAPTKNPSFSLIDLDYEGNMADLCLAAGSRSKHRGRKESKNVFPTIEWDGGDDGTGEASRAIESSDSSGSESEPVQRRVRKHAVDLVNAFKADAESDLSTSPPPSPLLLSRPTSSPLLSLTNIRDEGKVANTIFEVPIVQKTLEDDLDDMNCRDNDSNDGDSWDHVSTFSTDDETSAQREWEEIVSQTQRSRHSQQSNSSQRPISPNTKSYMFSLSESEGDPLSPQLLNPNLATPPAFLLPPAPTPGPPVLIPKFHFPNALGSKHSGPQTPKASHTQLDPHLQEMSPPDSRRRRQCRGIKQEDLGSDVDDMLPPASPTPLGKDDAQVPLQLIKSEEERSAIKIANERVKVLQDMIVKQDRQLKALQESKRFLLERVQMERASRPKSSLSHCRNCGN